MGSISNLKLDSYFPILKSFLLSMAAVPEIELQSFMRCLELKAYDEGSFFTEAGDTHDRVGLVLKGIFRVFYPTQEGGVHVRNFCKEGMPMGSYATILNGEPAHVCIEALEPSLVAQFSFREMELRYDQHPCWERVGRKIAESYYILRERREYHLLALDAAERLEEFFIDYPGLHHRISHANIASYIGVAPETVSRLLKKRQDTSEDAFPSLHSPQP